MFGIGMPEMLLILAVALIVFGPKRLPELAKSLGRALGEFKRATSDLKESIETESGLDEVRTSINDVKKDIQSPTAVSTDAAKKASSESKSDQSDDPLAKVKTAFDQMNDDVESPVSENHSKDKPGEADNIEKNHSKTASDESDGL